MFDFLRKKKTTPMLGLYGEEDGKFTFFYRCPECGRMMKSDVHVSMKEAQAGKKTNCSQCGMAIIAKYGVLKPSDLEFLSLRPR